MKCLQVETYADRCCYCFYDFIRLKRHRPLLKTQLLLQMTFGTKLCALLFYFVFKRLTPPRNARHFLKCCQIVLLRLRHSISYNVQKQFEKKNQKNTIVGREKRIRFRK